jgi:hypothetical protein
VVHFFGQHVVLQVQGSKQLSVQVVVQCTRLPGLQYVSVTHSPHFFCTVL